MILIADSGSTKTDWCYIDTDHELRFVTQGINPVLQTEEAISRIISEELLPQMCGCCLLSIYFYGAGCTKEKREIVSQTLQKAFPQVQKIEVNSDLLGAARALCGREEGIACILGTGSNSCYYNGTEIIAQTSPLGYILGDEGGAAYIGKRLIGNCLKHQFSDLTCELFFQETSLTLTNIIDKVYKQPMPNRFLGEISQFCQHHLDIAEVREFVVDCFCEFIIRNIDYYHSGNPKINCVGSIAYVYRSEFEEAAKKCGYELGKVIKAPIDELIKYHR